MKITAYADKTSVAPDETINFMVNCNAKEFKADFVKLICGDMNPDGPGYQEKVIRTKATGTYPGRKQNIYAGSFVQIEDNEKFNQIESFTLKAFIWPTTPNKGHQTIISNWSEKDQNGMSLDISPNNKGLMLTIGSGSNKVQCVVSGKPFLER
ncbi:MAG: N,N-dimethylformamidase beta subunit family domain-containing protein, partial [Nitrospinaceae bacterium]